MKTKIFILAIAASFISTLGLTAQNKLFSNVETRENETIKELTLFDENTSKPLFKKVHHYDLSGTRQKTSLFEWDAKEGWVESRTYTYKYSDNKIASINFAKKDKKNGKWLPLVYNIIYSYDKDGELLSMENIMVENIIDNMLVQK